MASASTLFLQMWTMGFLLDWVSLLLTSLLHFHQVLAIFGMYFTSDSLSPLPPSDDLSHNHYTQKYSISPFFLTKFKFLKNQS